MEIYIREWYLMNLVACEDHNFFDENDSRMLIAAIFWQMERIRSAIERQYIYIFFIFAAMSSLFSHENWDQRL